MLKIPVVTCMGMQLQYIIDAVLHIRSRNTTKTSKQAYGMTITVYEIPLERRPILAVGVVTCGKEENVTWFFAVIGLAKM